MAGGGSGVWWREEAWEKENGGRVGWRTRWRGGDDVNVREWVGEGEKVEVAEWRKW